MKYHYLKTTVIAWALIIALIGFYVSLFVLREWLISPIWLVGVFCILPYAVIYFHRHWKYGFGLIVVLSLSLGFYLGWDIYLFLGFISALIGFYQTAHTIDEDVHNKIKVSSYDVFTGESVGKFVTYMTMVYVFTFVSFYDTFDLECEELYGFSNQMVDVILLRSNPETVDKIQGYVSDFFVKDKDTLAHENINDPKPVIETTTKIIPVSTGSTSTGTVKSDPGAQYRVKDSATTTVITTSSESNDATITTTTPKQTIIETVTIHDAPTTTNDLSAAALLRSIEAYRKSLIAQTVDNSDSIEQGVCATIIGEIQEKYSDPDFKISVIFLMYLLISPALEVSLHIISYVNRGLFQILFKRGLFKKTQDREVSENIQ